MRLISLIALFSLAACIDDAPTRDASTPLVIWQLDKIDGVAFAAHATFGISSDRVSGRGPCNQYSATVTHDFPAVIIRDVVATEMACDDLAAEQQFFDILGQVTAEGVGGDYLFLLAGEHRLDFIRIPVN